MNKIKFLKSKDSMTGAIHAILNGNDYRPYTIGNLPNTFAFTIQRRKRPRRYNFSGLTIKDLTYVRV